MLDKPIDFDQKLNCMIKALEKLTCSLWQVYSKYQIRSDRMVHGKYIKPIVNPTNQVRTKPF